MAQPIPSLANIQDPAIRTVLAAVIENLEEVRGQRGDPKSTDRAVTVEELVDAGLAESTGGVLSVPEATAGSSEPRFTKWLERGGSRSPKCLSKAGNFSVSADLSGSCFSNHDAKGIVRADLPAARKGMSFTFIRETDANGGNYAFKIYPAKGEAIWNPSSYTSTPSTNYGLSLNTFRARVKVSCHVDGTWSIEIQDGTIGYGL